jgi:hypothetical protein
MIGTTPYFVNGLGGRSIYDFGTPLSGSQLRYNSDYGAMLVTADATAITYQFIDRNGQVIDTYTESQTPIFDDVPYGHWAFDYINALFNAGYVAGCSATPRLYCPDNILSRAESAVFVLRGQYGAIPDPPYSHPHLHRRRSRLLGFRLDRIALDRWLHRRLQHSPAYVLSRHPTHSS